MLGGYRTVISESGDNGIGCGLHLAQICLYLIVPASVTAAILAFPAAEARLPAALAIGGLIPVAIGLPLSIAAKVMGQQESNDDADEVSCCSREGFLFLIPPKSGWLEVIYSAVL